MQKVDVLLGGWLDGAVLRNQVTNSLTTITVIKVGIVNCFLLVLMSLGWQGGCGCRNAIRETEGGGRRWGTFVRDGEWLGKPGWGEGSGRWSTGLNCQSRLWLGGTDAAMWEMNFMAVDSAISPGMWGFAAERESLSDRGLTLFMFWHNKTEAWKMREETDVHSN